MSTTAAIAMAAQQHVVLGEAHHDDDDAHNKQHAQQQLRAMSLPDMSELSDIACYEALFQEEEKEQDSFDTQNHPVRLFGLGLQRSMSMPKQQTTTKSETKQQEDETFYFPEEPHEQQQHAKRGFLPSFYSQETLRSVLPPPSATTTSSSSSSRVHTLLEVSQEELPPPPSTSNDSHDSHTDQEEESDEKESVVVEKEINVAKTTSESTQTHVAIANLSAFFGAPVATTTTTSMASPKSTIQFPEPHQQDEETKQLNTRSNSLQTVQTAEPSQRRRSIFSTTTSSTHEDANFPLLSSRRSSMPTNLPSSKLPRKPSLKRVSSIKSMGSVKSDKSSRSELKPSVSFSNLEIREYDVTLGDNPSCSHGPPVSLGWEYRDAEVVPVETYEKARTKFPRRNPRQLVLSYNVRNYLLLKSAGYSKAELREAMKEVERIKNQRKITDMFLPASKLDEVMEGVLDHVKVMFQKQH